MSQKGHIAANEALLTLSPPRQDQSPSGHSSTQHLPLSPGGPSRHPHLPRLPPDTRSCSTATHAVLVNRALWSPQRDPACRPQTWPQNADEVIGSFMSFS